jgi:hypothetical protein
VLIRLNPQKDWDVNQPKQPATVLEKLEAIQKEFGLARRPDRSRRRRCDREDREGRRFGSTASVRTAYPA